MRTATMTSHCAYDRYERIQNIINYIGLGNIVQERIEVSTNRNFARKVLCVTDTGVTIVKSEDKMRIITIYVTTTRELIRVYNGRMNVPESMWMKVQYNEQRYIRNGKTIWP